MVVNINQLNQPSIQPSVNRDISEIGLNVVLKDLLSFGEFQTEEFFVSGNAWQIKFRKTNENSLGIYLQSNAIFLGRVEKLIVASCNVQLLSSSPNQRSHAKLIDVAPFSSQNFHWGIDNFIDWNQLMDYYAAENICNFKIMVKATPTLIAAQNEWLNFEEIAVGGSSERKTFQMTIQQIHNVIGVSSPNIMFNGASWRIVVEYGENAIIVKMMNTSRATCRVSAVIQLMSFDRNVNALTFGNGIEVFNVEEFYRSWNINLIDLFDPEKQFIHDGQTFVIKIEMKLDPEENDDDN